MGLFNRRKEHISEGTPPTVAVQTCANASHPFSDIDRYSPLQMGEKDLYLSLREAIPIIDAAIQKLIYLTGGFTVTCPEKYANTQLQEFLRNVQVGSAQTGIDMFMTSYFDSLLTFGTAVGEMVIQKGQIRALYNAPLDHLEMVEGETPLDAKLCVREQTGELMPVKYPDFILYSVLNPRPGELKGNSLLQGLPFVSSILLKIYNTIGLNFERVGNVRFAVTYKPKNDVLDKAYAKERAEQIASEWRNAMQTTSQVKDFVAVGDVDIKVIGADNQILDTQVPVRHMLEQIVAKTGLPPFMLGLHWSSTERMSMQQSDVLTSELKGYRRILTPAIVKIANIFLRLQGFNETATVQWDDIMLQDKIEESKARLYAAQAKKLEMAIANREGGEQNEETI